MRGTIAFAIGFGAAMAAGWAAFPRLLYVRQSQPLEFRHKTHAAKSGTAQCGDCHAIRPDGAFAGIPKNGSCAGCHADVMGSSAAEATLVKEYLKPEREVRWLVYSRQPANVRFSHAIHSRPGGPSCADCHGTEGETDTVRVYEENRISGYSRDIWGRSISRLRRKPHEGMKMSDCEACHRDRGFETGCLGCHQ